MPSWDEAQQLQEIEAWLNDPKNQRWTLPDGTTSVTLKRAAAELIREILRKDQDA